MFRIIKWALAVLAVFVVVSATPEQRTVMYKGVEAFGEATITACSRQESICVTALTTAKAGLEAVIAKLNEKPGRQHETLAPGRRPLDGSERRPPVTTEGGDGTYYR